MNSLVFRTIALFASTLLVGCAHRFDNSESLSDHQKNKVVDFYWHYAILAAKVYSPNDELDARLHSLANSSWIRSELSEASDAQRRENEALLNKPRKLLLEHRQSTCRGKDNCRPKEPPHEAIDDIDNKFIAQEPKKSEDCDYNGKLEPSVHLQAALDFGWEEVLELRRQTHPRGWSVFVPGLAVDVWRRRRLEFAPQTSVEYAIVYRGTVGHGGWVSNFRTLAAFTPFIWDQYRQLEFATQDLIDQIYKLHDLSDALQRRRDDTKILITTVGHSLGGGLATYAFLRLPQVTRVIGFNSSPIDGSSLFTPSDSTPKQRAEGRLDRLSINRRLAAPLDLASDFPDAGIHLLYERGEPLHRLVGCHSGKLWGDEGGPRISCNSMNLSGGNVIRQHNMPQLACRLYLEHKNQLKG